MPTKAQSKQAVSSDIEVTQNRIENLEQQYQSLSKQANDVLKELLEARESVSGGKVRKNKSKKKEADPNKIASIQNIGLLPNLALKKRKFSIQTYLGKGIDVFNDIENDSEEYKKLVSFILKATSKEKEESESKKYSDILNSNIKDSSENEGSFGNWLWENEEFMAFIKQKGIEKILTIKSLIPKTYNDYFVLWYLVRLRESHIIEAIEESKGNEDISYQDILTKSKYPLPENLLDKGFKKKVESAISKLSLDQVDLSQLKEEPVQENSEATVASSSTSVSKKTSAKSTPKKKATKPKTPGQGSKWDDSSDEEDNVISSKPNQGSSSKSASTPKGSSSSKNSSKHSTPKRSSTVLQMLSSEDESGSGNESD